VFSIGDQVKEMALPVIVVMVNSFGETVWVCLQLLCLVSKNWMISVSVISSALQLK